MLSATPTHTRREFINRLGALGISVSLLPLSQRQASADDASEKVALTFPGPWQFLLPKPGIILVSDQQLEDLQDPDKGVDLSLSDKPNVRTLRQICESARAQGARTVILAFDEFWTQYRKGQGGKPRELLPDTTGYIQRLAKISETLKAYGLGLELSLLSPLELGRGFERATSESGRWVQYREGYRDPKTGAYNVSLWEQRRWTNNKGAIDIKRTGLRILAFREQRVGGTAFYAVDPAGIRELKAEPQIDLDDSSQSSTGARRLVIRGRGDTDLGDRNRVLVIVSYATPEMDYFSPKALPFLRELVQQYHQAGVPLNGLYSDEMHIQQDWGYASHHDEGQFTFRYLTSHLADKFAEIYGAEFKDLEKYLVYFCYSQHGFLPNLEARLPAQHVLGHTPEDVQNTFLLRRRYYDLLERTVVDLFVKAKRFAEEKYGHELEARAHATWAQSPTCDIRHTGTEPVAPRQYEYTPEFLWSNTVHQAASACSDYFEWNEFLTGGGNDHAEGGWSDRNYYGIALGCSTGILNRVPYAYAAAWGLPHRAGRQRQAVCDAFGASAHPWFQAVQDSQHRDVEVLMVYPSSLVACEERFGSWMTQYAYANYVTGRKLLQHGSVSADGSIRMAGRQFNTVAVLFEPMPPPGLLEFLQKFAEAGGRLIWSGPAPRTDLAGAPLLNKFQPLCGIAALRYGVEGVAMPGWTARFEGAFSSVPAQTVLTDFLVDRVYSVDPGPEAQVVARLGERVTGVYRRLQGGGSITYLGFRPRDDQAASLGQESRTWFEVLRLIGAYPGSQAGVDDNPSVVSRTTPYVACRFPNGTTTVGAHYRNHVESWPGGFHRDNKQDEEILTRNPLPDPRLSLQGLRVNGHVVDYEGHFTVAFRPAAERGRLSAFAGHNCREITVDGHRTTFGNNRMNLVAWAPVLPERRVPGGALMEIWVDGEGEVRVPLPEGTTKGVLHLQGSRFDTIGGRVDSSVEGQTIAFQATKGGRHLFLLPA